MKKHLVMMLTLLTMCFAYSSCSSDDDDEKFNYPMETLYGTWDLTDVQLSTGEWIDLTNWLYSQYRASITFKSDGSYIGNGSFGNGTGRYKAVGNTIITYVDGKEYLRYVVKSVNGNKMEGTIFDSSSSSMPFKATKR